MVQSYQSIWTLNEVRSLRKDGLWPVYGQAQLYADYGWFVGGFLTSGLDIVTGKQIGRAHV